MLALALALALAPAGAFASTDAPVTDAAAGDAGPAAAAPVSGHALDVVVPGTSGEVAPAAVAPPRFVDEETRPLPPVDPDDVSEHTMTFYYYEPMDYEDPDYSDPSGIRLLKKRVVSGLKAGQVLDTADYVEDIEGHVFFDAYPAKPVVSSDESLNYVELVYFKTRDSSCTVNYFEVKGKRGAVIGSDDVDVEKMGSFTIENQRFDQKIEGRQVAAPLEEMMYLDSYPESIRLKESPEENVLNVFYAPALATLPDDVVVPEDQLGPSDPGAPDVGDPGEPPAGAGPDDPAEGVPPAGADPDEPPAGDGSGGSAGDAPPAGVGPDDAVDLPAGPGSGAPEASPGVDEGPGEAPGGDDAPADVPARPSELPQTGDPLPSALVGALAVAGAAAFALAASGRRLRVPRG